MAALTRLTRALSQERASSMAQEAVSLAKIGNLEAAAMKLREAAALGHDNADVQAAFLTLHSGQDTPPLVDLCRRYAQYHDRGAGANAVSFLRSPEAANLGSAALECIKLVLDEASERLDASQDIIIAELARHSLAVRTYFTAQLALSTTEFFDNVYARGDDAANCLRLVVLDPKLWDNEDTRLRVEDDLFQLFFAKLMESGHDHDGRALKGITLLFLADTERLHYFIDDDAAEAVLTSMDFRLPSDVRGQATLVYSKFLEESEVVAQALFTNFITKHITRQKGDDLIMAFAAATALFPVAPALTAQMFLTDGFVPAIMPLLQRKFTGSLVQDSFLAMLNAACIDGACRATIQENCGPWLSHLVSNGTGKQPAMAATILAKLRTSGTKGNEQRARKADEDVSELVELFQKTLTTTEGKNISDSIEGLAYTSLNSQVKEQLASDQVVLKSLLRALENNPAQPEIIIGGLSIISNLTHYLPTLSEEQKKISQLKAYANASKPVEPDPLEGEDYVRARCISVVDAGTIATLVKINKGASSATAHLTDQILLSLARNQKDRGRIAQQGAVRLLIQHALKSAQPLVRPPTPRADKSSKLNSQHHPHSHHDAAHALARILISLNPAHVFPTNGTPHITDAIPPLLSLLKQPDADTPNLTDAPKDLLPMFESLLALTNLASSPDQSASTAIIRLGWTDIEDLLLASNVMLRRAACELICNLVAYPTGVGKFADGTRRAVERLKILVAMADVDDDKTRSAAGGALAMLTEFEPVLQSLLISADDKGKRTIEIILDLVGDTDVGLVHRGLATVLNFVNADDDLGQTAITALKSVNGSEQIKQALRRIREPNVLQLGVEVLKKLQ